MFPEAYHTLVHSPIPHLFDAILDLEREYAGEVDALLSARDAEISEIRARYTTQAFWMMMLPETTPTENISLHPHDAGTPQLYQAMYHSGTWLFFPPSMSRYDALHYQLQTRIHLRQDVSNSSSLLLCPGHGGRSGNMEQSAG